MSLGTGPTSPHKGYVPVRQRGHILPADAGDQDVEQSVEAFVIAGWRPPFAAPDDGGQQRFKEGPDFLGQPTRDGMKFHGRSLLDSWTAAVIVGLSAATG